MTVHPIHLAARPYLTGWRYGHGTHAAYAPVVGPLKVATTDADRKIDCTTQTASILMRAYPSAPWTARDYADLQIASRPVVLDAPVVAIDRLGIGKIVQDFQPGRWHLVQGWRDDKPPEADGDGFDGHAIIVYDRGNGILDVLESTSKEGGKGPRWRVTTAAKLRDEFPAALFIAVLVDP